MEKFRYYNVSFSGLNLGEHDFEFHITQPFFDLFEFEQDFQKPDLKLKLVLDKKNNFLELHFKLKGTVELNCDLTNEPYSQKIKGKSDVIVKFGEEHDYSDDEVWVIPQGEHSVNIAQMVYEMTLLALPIKRIHPDVESGKSHSKMLELLNQYSLDNESEIIEEENSNDEEIDPRWEQLKKLKNNN
ncbi:YceD family protein [Moheibacter sediminis]|uniref:Uncharacterized metal-binding protein YceD, DUF177 family n=1 Tax=Moheibacter sediminis TaxID=1434700 RepID=A0A1W1ZWF7_9FLAO|nr:DUF177 domain-containing protein [Moheibacter sediminis]SMC52750.1 Uncharacterized metal-binding protein YceD, DUF177 family [Moheibacter sediminis]